MKHLGGTKDLKGIIREFHRNRLSLKIFLITTGRFTAGTKYKTCASREALIACFVDLNKSPWG